MTRRASLQGASSLHLFHIPSCTALTIPFLLLSKGWCTWGGNVWLIDSRKVIEKLVCSDDLGNAFLLSSMLPDSSCLFAGGHHGLNPFQYTSDILHILWRLQQISSWTNNSGETILHLVIWFILVIITGLDYNFYHLEFNLLHRQLKPDNSHIKLWIMISPGIKF